MKYVMNNCLAIFFALILSLLATPLYALSSPVTTDEALTVRLISATEATDDQNEILLGLDIQLTDGWHTYWRNPGAAGAPPTLDWKKSTNLKDAKLLYPAPHRMSLYGMDSIGYMDHLVFPIRATAEKPNQPLDLALSLDILVCKEMCLPKHFDLALSIPAGAAKDSTEAPLLTEAMDKLPTTLSSKNLSIKNVTRSENKVIVEIASTQDLTAPDMFVETDKAYAFSAPASSIEPNRRSAILTATLESTLPQGKSLGEIPLTLTVVSNADAVEASVTQDGPIAMHPTHKTPDTPLRLGMALLFALLGGFILNLMPCVLPVLSLKVLSVVKHGGNDHNKIRQSFMSSAAGILFSFLILAGITIALKEGGQVIGWGLQFQQPTFLVFMITLLTLFAANLWGFFEITLPRFIMDSVDPVHHPKLAGDFGTGILATLLATPCSAPFLGTAIGFALSAGASEILMIFVALGLGMATPYVIIALWPRLAGSLPKPGAWMVMLTRTLGFGLAGTAGWLMLVLHEQIGRQLTALITLGMIAILVQLYLRHKNILRFLTIPVILLVFAGSFTIGLAATVPQSVSQEAGVWEKFDEAALHRHVREGKTVFLDITADWCITCKANKRFTIGRDEVSEKIFNAKNVVAMQGNWTNPDPQITAFLQKQGRYGIPFNAVFGPKAPDGILLPELLTPSTVLKALNDAKEPSRTCPAHLPKGKDC